MSSIFKRKNKKSRDSVSNGPASPNAASSASSGLGGLASQAQGIASKAQAQANNVQQQASNIQQQAQQQGANVQSQARDLQNQARDLQQNVQQQGQNLQQQASNLQQQAQNLPQSAKGGFSGGQQGFSGVQQGFQNTSNSAQQGFNSVQSQAQQGYNGVQQQAQQGYNSVKGVFPGQGPSGAHPGSSGPSGAHPGPGPNQGSNQGPHGPTQGSNPGPHGQGPSGAHGPGSGPGPSHGPGPGPSGAHGPGYSPITPQMEGFNTPHGRSPFPQMSPQGGRSPQFQQGKFAAANAASPGPGHAAQGAVASPGGSPNHPWTKVPITNASPFPRYGHASNYVAARDGEIFVMGGLKGADVFGDLWVIETDSMAGFLLETEGCPSPRVGHAALTLGNAFIVFGGDTKVTDTDTPDDNLYLLNTSTLKWTVANPKGSRPAGRYGHSLSTVGSKLFVFGGQLDDYFFDDLVCFDLTKLRSPECRWTTIEPADGVSPPPRTNHTVVTYQDKLYMYGGTDGQLWYSDTWCFDPVTSLWTQLNCSGFIPTPSEGHAATVVNDIMYVFGGRSSKGDDLGVLSALKLSSKRWFTFENMGQAPAPRSGHSMTAYSNHKVLVMGGESHDQDDTHVYVLDTSRIKYPPKANPAADGDTSVQSISSLSSQNAPPVHSGHSGLQSGRQSPQTGYGHPPAPGAVPLPGMADRSFDRSTASAGSADRSVPDRSVGSIDDEKYDRGYMQPGQVDDEKYDSPVQNAPGAGVAAAGVAGAAAAGVAGVAAGAAASSKLAHRSSNLGSNSEEFESADDGRPVSSEAGDDVYGSPSSKIPAAWPKQEDYKEDSYGKDKDSYGNNAYNTYDSTTPRDEREIGDKSFGDKSGYAESADKPYGESTSYPESASSPTATYNGSTHGAHPSAYDDSDYSQHTTPADSAVTSPVNYGARDRDGEAHVTPGVSAAAAGVAGVTAGVAGMNIHQKANNVKIEPSEPGFDAPRADRGLEAAAEPTAHAAATHPESAAAADTTVDSEGDVQDVIEQLKATNSWYESELTVAKQSGYTPSKNPVADIEKVRRRSLRYSRDQGASLSERDILVQALVEVKQELQNVKSDVTRQSEEASQKLKQLNDENQELRAQLEGSGSGSGSRGLAAGAGAGAGALAGGAVGAAAASGDSDLAAKHAELQKKYNLLVGGASPASGADGSRELGPESGNVHQLLKQEQNKNASLEYELETLKDELATTQTKWKDVGGAANNHVSALQAAGAALAASQAQHSLLQRDLDTHKTARSAADDEVLQLKRQLEDAERRLAQAEEELQKEQQLGVHAREQNEHSTQAMTGGIDKILAMWGGSALIGGAAGYAGNSLANGSRGVDDESPEGASAGINAHPQFVAMQKQVDGATKLHQLHKEAAEQATSDLAVAQQQVEELKSTLLKSEQQNHELLGELEELKGHVTEHRRALEDHEQTRSEAQTHALRLKELEAELATTLDTHRTELDNLESTHRNKLGEMEKAKKDSLTYMQNSDLALRKTREELSRSKEQISQLQDELSELQIRGKGAPRGAGHDYDDDDDDDDEKFGSHQLELQLRDTRATLVVVEQERDELRLANADLRKKAITNVQDVEKYKRRYQRLKQRGGEDSFGESEFDQTHTSGFESPRQ
ncbi:Tip elongation aberrant protein 1 [Yarrowia sp. B02]|nr:Tip elongation aberrant protein 1 [Yarrowia sp. B02]